RSLPRYLRPIQDNVICLDILIFKRRQAKHCAVAVASKFAELLSTKNVVKPLFVGGELTVRQVVKSYPVPQVGKHVKRVCDTQNELIVLAIDPRSKGRVCQL